MYGEVKRVRMIIERDCFFYKIDPEKCAYRHKYKEIDLDGHFC